MLFSNFVVPEFGPAPQEGVCWRHVCTLAWHKRKGAIAAKHGSATDAWQRQPFRLCCGPAPTKTKQEKPVPDDLSEIRYQVALANRLLANEGVLDAFGHVSMRHPGDPGRYLLPRSRSPGLIEADDVLEFTLDSDPVEPPSVQLYAERVIHGCIYQARPDVMAVCHHHAPAVMPFCIAGVPIVPVSHLGAAGGETMPFWNQRDEFGDTNLLVVKPEEGRSLARALGSYAAVLMNHHGATVVGRDLRELVSRSIFMCHNAEYQLRAQLLGAQIPGKVPTLTAGETRLAGVINAMPNVTNRTWEYWTLRLDKAGGLPPRAKARPRAASVRGKTSRKMPSRKATARGRSGGKKARTR
jgi:ribulose-5-phosphate 4-epimerase/fuculose-1-phosphate aldolase